VAALQKRVSIFDSSARHEVFDERLLSAAGFIGRQSFAAKHARLLNNRVGPQRRIVIGATGSGESIIDYRVYTTSRERTMSYSCRANATRIVGFLSRFIRERNREERPPSVSRHFASRARRPRRGCFAYFDRLFRLIFSALLYRNFATFFSRTRDRVERNTGHARGTMLY
jgi:hypothetical protein